MKKTIVTFILVIICFLLSGCKLGLKTVDTAGVGDVFEFGMYEADQYKSDGKVVYDCKPYPIKWRVLIEDKHNQRKLVICESGIDQFPDSYGKNTDDSVSYMESRVHYRLWWKFLNCFDSNERKMILSIDKRGPLFLLNRAEVEKYFDDIKSRQCLYSEFTKNLLNSIDKSSDYYEFSVKSSLKTESIGWWLCPDDIRQKYKKMPYVDNKGEIGKKRFISSALNNKIFERESTNFYTQANAMTEYLENCKFLVIRPAMWIKIR